jgi:GNAT superfamily N-acetyltransferase
VSRPSRVTEEGVRAAFHQLRSRVDIEVRALLDEVLTAPDVAFLLFDVRSEVAFDEFPITVELFRVDGERSERGRPLLRGTTLLPPDGSYPLGRVDLFGVDTTPDAAIVEHVCIDEFRRLWRDVGRELPGVRVLLGGWVAYLEAERAFPLVDLATGESVIVDVLWEPGAEPALRYGLSRAQRSDLDFMYAVKKRGMQAYVEATWGPWDEADQRARFERGFTPEHDRIVLVDGRRVGTLSVDWRRDPVFIAGIYVDAHVRGHGLGAAVIGDVLAQARGLGRTVALRVLKTNPRARALYARLGFAVCGTTDTHVEMRWTGR